MIFPALSFLCFSLFFVLDKPTQLKSSPLPLDDKVPMAHNNSDPLSSHVLDTSIGKPGSGIRVVLSKQDGNGEWRQVNETVTNSDGRIRKIISTEQFTAGVYKLYFDTKPYFAARGQDSFYPFVEVAFEIIRPEEHYHVPILISAYGFSTYRGS